MMAKSNSNTKRKGIWLLFTEEQLAAAIVLLGGPIKALGEEIWRLNVETGLPTSLWFQITEKLKIVHNEKIRHSLYKIWHSNSHNIYKYVQDELKSKNRIFTLIDIICIYILNYKSDL